MVLNDNDDNDNNDDNNDNDDNDTDNNENNNDNDDNNDNNDINDNDDNDIFLNKVALRAWVNRHIKQVNSYMINEQNVKRSSVNFNLGNQTSIHSKIQTGKGCLYHSSYPQKTCAFSYERKKRHFKHLLHNYCTR